jgi:CBS domain-containing protein
MTTAATDILSYVAELSDRAWVAFGENLADMFDADLQCVRRHAAWGHSGYLCEHVKGLAAVHSIQAEGALSGTFDLWFDQAGLFLLGGMIVMLPEPRILESLEHGSRQDAESLEDAVREVGNLLVGAWGRVFSQDCPGHKHLLRTGTFVGKPWEGPGVAALRTGDEALILRYEMTIDPYPSFTCAVVFPRAVLAGLGDAATGNERGASVRGETRDVGRPTPNEMSHATDERGTPPETRAATRNAQAPDPPAPIPSVPPTGPAGPSHESAPLFLDPAHILSSSHPASPEAEDRAWGASSDPTLAELLRLPAAEIMDKDVFWADPEEMVRDVIAKMQQHNVGYVLVGRHGALEGLVSGSNILGAVSLYLRPVFAQWRRPEDEATLSVKVKWIMSRPVRTVRPEATLAALIEILRRGGGRCLPVVDARGTVRGLVTVFDILLRVLAADQSVSWQGRPPQAPALLL